MHPTATSFAASRPGQSWHANRWTFPITSVIAACFAGLVLMLGVAADAAAQFPFVPDEVLVELDADAPARTVDALQRQHRLRHLETQTVALTNTRIMRLRIPDGRPVANVVRALEARSGVRAQPNYVFRTDRAEVVPGAGGSDLRRCPSKGSRGTRGCSPF